MNSDIFKPPYLHFLVIHIRKIYVVDDNDTTESKKEEVSVEVYRKKRHTRKTITQKIYYFFFSLSSIWFLTRKFFVLNKSKRNINLN